ncbi:FAD-binding protein, partial [Ketobacter sp.]
MITNTADVREGDVLESEIVIVGAGAAGIPMALDFAEAGFSVLLLESGESDQSDDMQALYSGTVTDRALHNPPETYRQRRLGGTTAIWGGRCVPFDPIDFE